MKKNILFTLIIVTLFALSCSSTEETSGAVKKGESPAPVVNKPADEKTNIPEKKTEGKIIYVMKGDMVIGTFPERKKYRVTGTNPDGITYNGHCYFVRYGNYFKFTLITGGITHHGTGSLIEGRLEVKWGTNKVTYILREDGTINGEWKTPGGMGFETIEPNKAGSE